MTNLNTQKIGRFIEIGDNHIKYNNEILKISNISRTWIFRFENVERIRYERAVSAYEEAKAQYERSETIARNTSIRNNVIIAFVLLLISIFAFSSNFVGIGALLLGTLCIFIYLAFRAYNRDIEYPKSPPKARPFPNKYGLSIEMNSGYITTFAAIGDDGINALGILQSEIDNADIHMAPTVFNMNDFNVTVENNEGIISAGDYAKNIIYKAEEGYL